MSRKRGRAESDDGSEIDLTPMLDVVFIMLIFFIVTASFIKESSIALNVPEKQDEKPPTTESANILVSVTASNEIWLEQRRIDVRAVRANIERLYAEFPKAIVIIKADGESSAKTFVAVADAARAAGVKQVSLARID